MKTLLFSLVVTALCPVGAYANDFSESGSELQDRVTKGCKKYAAKKTKEASENYFNINFWSGGNVGTGSVIAMEEGAKVYERFMQIQCENMVTEVLELKLGFGPWQMN